MEHHIGLQRQAGHVRHRAGDRAHIVRTVDGKPTKIKVRLADIAEKGDLKTNVAVRPGDVLVIPESRF